MAMRGSERPQIETETEAKQGTGPRDNLRVLIWSLVILAVIAVVLFWGFGFVPGSSPPGVDKG